jgi:drug/metabolite transporter (DMT)-like permease
LISVFLIVQINTKEINKKYILLPVILFVGGGFIDISLNYNQVVHLKEGGSGLFSTVTFSTAFLAGFILLIFQLIKKKEKIRFKNILGGTILGCINWFSIFFLLLALKNPQWDSSTIYTVVNIGILLLVVITGVLVFKEKLNSKQWIGVLLAFSAIILISLAS